ncbi:hypothetical protein WJM97_06450 [Okeanomitos corallinicola TIOX110]|uniref:Uncharacterized protein n=1 Tax=Okeanomitos corallinicola TIOX110 TaxID=3133117 RepID=A0ABZ2UYM8_9CYAN
MWNLKDSITQVKNAFYQALQYIPDFNNLKATEKGKIVDASFKSLVKDLMDDFGMIPGEDYEDNLRDNEPGADFVILSPRANNLIKDLLDGKITVIKEHTRVSKTGNAYTVNAHYRKIA